MVVHICKASSWKAEAGVSSKLRGSLIHKVSSTRLSSDFCHGTCVSTHVSCLQPCGGFVFEAVFLLCSPGCTGTCSIY